MVQKNPATIKNEVLFVIEVSQMIFYFYFTSLKILLIWGNSIFAVVQKFSVKINENLGNFSVNNS